MSVDSLDMRIWRQQQKQKTKQIMAEVQAKYPSKNTDCTYEILETRHKYFALDLLSQEFSQMPQGPFKGENICFKLLCKIFQSKFHHIIHMLAHFLGLSAFFFILYWFFVFYVFLLLAQSKWSAKILRFFCVLSVLHFVLIFCVFHGCFVAKKSNNFCWASNVCNFMAGVAKTYPSLCFNFMISKFGNEDGYVLLATKPLLISTLRQNNACTLL